MSSSFPLRRSCILGFGLGRSDEGQGVVDYVPAFAPDEPLSADADAIFLHASLAGQEHRPVGQLPHDARGIIGHSLGSMRCLPRGVRCCRLLLATRALISPSRKGACHRCSGSALSTATRFQEPHMQSEVVPTPARGFRRLAVASAAWLLIGVVTSCPALAAWPDRTITIIVQFAPGGSNDLLGRILAAELAPPSGRMSSLKIILGPPATSAPRRSRARYPTATRWGFSPAPSSSIRTSPKSPMTRSRTLRRSPIWGHRPMSFSPVQTLPSPTSSR